MAYLVSRLIRLAVKHPIGQFILAASFIFLGVDGIIEALAAHHSDLVGYLIVPFILLVLGGLCLVIGLKNVELLRQSAVISVDQQQGSEQIQPPE